MSITSAPPAGAGPVNVTVPVAPEPPATLIGATVKERSARFGGGVMVRALVWLTELNDAVIPTTAGVRIVVVSIVTVAEMLPCGTRTVAGTAASDGSSLANTITAPSTEAGLVSVTVAVTGRPPTTELGESDSDASTTGGGLIVSVAVAAALPAVARKVAIVVVATLAVDTATVAALAPAGTVTLAGIDTALLSLLSATTWPAGGAGPVSVTMAVADAPAVTLGG